MENTLILAKRILEDTERFRVNNGTRRQQHKTIINILRIAQNKIMGLPAYLREHVVFDFVNRDLRHVRETLRIRLHFTKRGSVKKWELDTVDDSKINKHISYGCRFVLMNRRIVDEHFRTKLDKELLSIFCEKYGIQYYEKKYINKFEM